MPADHSLSGRRPITIYANLDGQVPQVFQYNNDVRVISN